MKITFLGTSHGLPDTDRYCSSILLEVGERAYLIDGGAPVADLLLRRGIPYGKIRALFNTHLHSDHILGSLPLLSLINWYYREATITAYLPEEAGCRLITDLLILSDGTFDADRVRLVPYDASFRYADGVIDLTPIPTRHMAGVGRPSYAFLIRAEGKAVLFSGDFCGDLSDFPEILYREPVDLFVTECAHFSVEALVDKLRGTDRPALCARVAVTHIHPMETKEPQIREAAQAVELPHAGSVDVLSVVHDGDEIIL